VVVPVMVLVLQAWGPVKVRALLLSAQVQAKGCWQQPQQQQQGWLATPEKSQELAMHLLPHHLGRLLLLLPLHHQQLPLLPLLLHLLLRLHLLRLRRGWVKLQALQRQGRVLLLQLLVVMGLAHQLALLQYPPAAHPPVLLLLLQVMQ
jgi:hypothetical protein